MTTFLRISLTAVLLAVTFLLLPCKTMEILTLLAIVVALFREDLYSFYLPPRLVITSSTNHSHFHEAPATNQLTGEFVDNQAWFGVIVENRGIHPAKNVEVLFNGIDSNRILDIARFRSLPLVRSWIRSPVVSAIHRNTPIRFDICYMQQLHPQLLSFAFLSTPNALAAIQCPAPQVSTFDCEVVAVSDNAPVARKTIRISYNGTYYQGFNVVDL